MKLIKVSVISTALLGVLVSFQNCGKIAVTEISEVAKAKTLAGTGVFGEPPAAGNSNSGDSGQTPVIGGGNGGDNGNTPVSGGSTGGDNGNTPVVGGSNGGDNGNTPVVGGTTGGDNGNTPVSGGSNGGDDDGGTTPVVGGADGAEIPVVRVCVDELLANEYVYNSRDVRANSALIKSKALLKQAAEAKVLVRRMDNHSIVCDEKANQKELIQKSSKIVLSKECLAKIQSGVNYDIIIHDPKEPVMTLGSIGQADMLVKTVKPYWWQRDDHFEKSSKKNSFSVTGEAGLRVLYDRATVAGKQNPDPNCDSSNADPLIISLDEKVDYIRLTAQRDGIDFDILGRNSSPAPFAPKRISWFENVNHSYYFLVLPNAQGEVTGIDQMFGDNTFGPDGKFAKDGYSAIAKYDLDKDRKITANDQIFASLRLWHDANLDGKSSPEELFTLDEKNIVVIDLRFKKNYFERDKYGNETRRKSVVKTKDGQYHLIFDLWFNYFKK